MNELTVNELFSGIGAFRKALERLGIPHRVVGISEIDRFAIASYEAIFGQTRNYGDISKAERLDYADMWTYGFPCQDISSMGAQAGIVEGQTRSGLLYEVKRLLTVAQTEGALPKYLILENVKQLAGKKFRADFDAWLSWLESIGYHNYWQVLSAVDYGIPQKRERVFVVSIRADIDRGFAFPQPIELTSCMGDYLVSDEEVPDKYWIKNAGIKEYTRRTKHTRYTCWRVGSLAGAPKWNNCFYNRRIYSPLASSPALCSNEGGANKAKILSEKKTARVLMPLEYWRLMGFDDEDFCKAQAAGISDTQLYKQAGNSIVVDVLEHLLGALFADQRGE